MVAVWLETQSLAGRVLRRHHGCTSAAPPPRQARDEGPACRNSPNTHDHLWVWCNQGPPSTGGGPEAQETLSRGRAVVSSRLGA